MPPKKKAKTTASTPKEQPAMWLVIFSEQDMRDKPNLQYALYDSIEKAKAGGILLMDRHSCWGEDWRNGLAGFGQEDKDNYLGFRYYPDDMGAGGGILVSNDGSNGRTKVSVSINRMQVNPQIQPPHVYEHSNAVAGDFF